MGKHFGKNLSKRFSGKYSPGMLAARQKRLDHAKQSAADALKTSSKRFTQKIVEEAGDLTGNKIANTIKNV